MKHRWHPIPVNGISITINNFLSNKGQALHLFKDGDGVDKETTIRLRY
ncbi:MAG: hypothetical protein WDO16_07750 [Bacteroidota bacterium]